MASNNEWKKYKIDDIGKVVGGGTPSTKNSEYFNGDIPWITPKDLSKFNGTYLSRGERNITKQGLENSSAKLLPKDTVLLSSRAPIGYLAIAANALSTNQGFKSIICDEDIVLPIYLFYSLKNDIERIKSLGTGSTFSELSGKEVKNIEVNIPSLKIQKKIVNILKNIDDKIEVNQKIIANLEELSQTIYKRWFVEFEFPDDDGYPYNSNKGVLINTNHGSIPEKWKILKLSDICEVRDGTHESPKQRTEGFPLVTSKHLKFYQLDLESAKLISQEDYSKINQRSEVHQHDILISMIGTIGRMYFVLEDDISYAIKNIGLIKSSQFDYPNFIYLSFKTPQMENYIKTHSAGSTQQYISLTELRKIPTLLPPDEILKKFNLVISPIFLEIRNSIEELENLVLLRDTLLPKLMSGEIELPDELEVDDHAELLQ